jgi:hyperosmotically inducible protein
MKPTAVRFAAVALCGLLAACAAAVIGPVTIAERVIEARSTADIAEDNRIVVAANKAMADVGTIKAATEIYEQRLLVTGIIADQADYDAFRAGIDAIGGVAELYWHVVQMSDADQEANADLLSWSDALALDAKVGIELIGTAGVADVNYRVAVDPFATVYLLGRARSRGELDTALAAARGTAGVREVVNYVEVRP